MIASLRLAATSASIRFNSRDGAIDSLLARKQLNNRFRVSIPEMVRLIGVFRGVAGGCGVSFNSRDGGIDSEIKVRRLSGEISFNSRDGAIDRISV